MPDQSIHEESGSAEIRPEVPVIEEEQTEGKINPSCTVCGDFRGGPLGHTAENCQWGETFTEQQRRAAADAEEAQKSTDEPKEAQGPDEGPSEATSEPTS